MYRIVFTARMKKDAKRMRKRGKDLDRLAEVLDMLASGKALPARYRDHQLAGALRGCRECHIEPDWLLIYRIVEERVELVATATGTHADLFGL